jgi:hypothetical protein
MINPQTQESFKELQSLSETNLPVPGQSLTNDPDTPLPFEQAPVHVELSPAIDDLLVRLCQPEIFQGIVGALADGVPVAEMAEQILFEGFVQGQYNPDLMLLLLEPVMYMIMALAERVGLGDLLGYEGEQSEDEYDEEEKQEKLMVLKDTIKNQINQVSEKSIEGMPSLQKQILNFEPSEKVQSLLSKDTNNSESLLERT